MTKAKKFSLIMMFMLLMSIITTQVYANNFNFNEKNFSNFDNLRLTDGLKDINPGNGIKEPREGTLIITEQPEDATAKVGDTVTLQIKVKGGKEPYSYQWQVLSGKLGDAKTYEFENSTAKGNATSILNPIVQTNATCYRCIVKDAEGYAVISGNVGVFKEPEIRRHPQDAKGNLGEQVTLDVVVVGGKVPYSYQWQKRVVGSGDTVYSDVERNTTNIFKPTVSILKFEYRCVITDANGNTVTSNPAIVYRRLEITKQPTKSVIGKLGEKVTLDVAADGGKKPYSYQWKRRKRTGTTFENSTAEGSKTAVLKPIVEKDAYYYVCVVTDAESDKVTSYQQAVEVCSLKIIKQPQDKTGKVGDIVTLEVIADGAVPPYRYQWMYATKADGYYRNSIAEGNKTKVLKVPVENQVYYYKCMVSDSTYHSAVSKPVRVARDVLTITKQPQDICLHLGDTVTLEVQVTGGIKPYEYQWQYRTSKGSFYRDCTGEGSKTGRLTFEVVKKGETYYRCIIKDARGNKIISREVTVKGWIMPLFDYQLWR
ncbi:immunoglobulin domain protein [Peptostreptococcaceae bacterium AS15]|nr:immunoglobulin domain protein [Peptostreptococcaceae bacterium AS15]